MFFRIWSNALVMVSALTPLVAALLLALVR
jgi:hypothetical protein